MRFGDHSVFAVLLLWPLFSEPLGKNPFSCAFRLLAHFSSSHLQNILGNVLAGCQLRALSTFQKSLTFLGFQPSSVLNGGPNPTICFFSSCFFSSFSRLFFSHCTSLMQLGNILCFSGSIRWTALRCS